MTIRKQILYSLIFGLLIASSEQLFGSTSDQQTPTLSSTKPIQPITDPVLGTMALRLLCAEQLAKNYEDTAKRIGTSRKVFNVLYKSFILGVEAGLTTAAAYSIAKGPYSSEQSLSNNKKATLFFSSMIALAVADYWFLPWFCKRKWGYKNVSLNRLLLSRVDAPPSSIRTEQVLAAYNHTLQSSAPIVAPESDIKILESFRNDFLSKLVSQGFITGVILDTQALAEQSIETQIKNMDLFRIVNSSFYTIAGKDFAEHVNQIMNITAAQNPATYLRLVALAYTFLVNA